MPGSPRSCLRPSWFYRQWGSDFVPIVIKRFIEHVKRGFTFAGKVNGLERGSRKVGQFPRNRAVVGPLVQRNFPRIESIAEASFFGDPVEMQVAGLVACEPEADEVARRPEQSEFESQRSTIWFSRSTPTNECYPGALRNANIIRPRYPKRAAEMQPARRQRSPRRTLHQPPASVDGQLMRNANTCQNSILARPGHDVLNQELESVGGVLF
jgi:hypothetical protein